MSRDAFLAFVIASLLLHCTISFAQEPDQDSTMPDLYAHEGSVSYDSISAWKASRKLAYLQNFDSTLRAIRVEPRKPLQTSSAQSKSKKRTASRTERDESRTTENYEESWAMRSFFSSSGLRIFLWLAVAAVIIFVLNRLVFQRAVFSRSTPASILSDAAQSEGNAKEDDLEEMIGKAIAITDYRLATRYLFLQALKNLHQKNLLHDTPGKTNFEYVQEISPRLRNDFSKLVLRYEYIWFGKVTIAASQFEVVQNQFKKFQDGL